MKREKEQQKPSSNNIRALVNSATERCCIPSNESKVKFATIVEGAPKVPFFNSLYTDVYGRALLLSLDCSTLRLIHTV